MERPVFGLNIMLVFFLLQFCLERKYDLKKITTGQQLWRDTKWFTSVVAQNVIKCGSRRVNRFRYRNCHFYCVNPDVDCSTAVVGSCLPCSCCRFDSIVPVPLTRRKGSESLCDGMWWILEQGSIQSCLYMYVYFCLDSDLLKTCCYFWNYSTIHWK